MANTKQAPKLIFKGAKPKDKTYYNLPQSMIDKVFDIIDGKHGNAIKLMIVLLGTLGDGTFGVSEKWIEERTGMVQQRYSEARQYLESINLVKCEKGKLVVNIDEIVKHKIKSDTDEPAGIDIESKDVISYDDSDTGFHF